MSAENRATGPETSAPAAVPVPAPAPAPPGQNPAEQGGANQLTPEEQMALFEKELKENDWGHQPC
jgi:hypothetical protein